MSKFPRILGLALTTAVLLPPGLASAQAAAAAASAPAGDASSSPAAAPPASAPAASAPASSTPPASAAPAGPSAPAAPADGAGTAPTSPAAAPSSAPAAVAGAQAHIPVALVITPEFKAVVWTHTSELFRPMYQLGDVNNLGVATAATLEDTLKAMALDVRVVDSPDEAQKLTGVSYVLVPTIQRFEQHNKGLTTFAPFVETIVVQWKVVDAKGATVLLDTALATATGKLGNNFVAADHAKAIEKSMLADLRDKSTTLLHPVLVSQ